MAATAYGSPSTNELLDLLATVEGASTFAVPGNTTVVFTKAFTLPKNHAFGLIYRFTGSNITVKVELEVGNVIPTDNTVHTNWAVAQVLDAAVVASVALSKAVTPVAAKYCRLKLTPSAANNADVLLVLAELCLSKLS